MKKIKNAKIESTMLGYEDHGILTIMIHVNYGGSSQGFGGYSLEGSGKYLREWIEGILKTVDVDQWERLNGTFVRVEIVEDRIVKIGHLLEDKWFDPKSI